MYLNTRLQAREAAAAQQTLDGFNPLKAIGRALGSTGRAIAGAAATAIGGPAAGAAVTGVLNTAAKMPAGKTSASPAPVDVPGSGPDSNQSKQPGTSIANPTGIMPQTGSPTMMDLLMAQMIGGKNAQVPMNPQYAPQPAGGGPVITMVPGGGGSPQYAPAPASAMPSWLIPAAIGAAGLMFVMSQKKGR
jgi:hypothetical protein